MLLNSADTTSNLFKDQVTPAIGTGLNALDVGNNPYIKGAAEAAIQPVFKQLTESALPAIKAGANATGNAGSSRQGIAEGQAIGDAARAASNATAAMYGNAYGQGLSSLNSTLGQIPGLINAYSTPGQVASSVGAQDRALEQARIDEAISRYNYEQNLPYNKLTEYSNLITTPTGGTSQTTVEGTPADQASQIISMILGGASQIPGVIDIFKDIFKGGGAAPDPNTIDLGSIYGMGQKTPVNAKAEYYANGGF